MPNTAVDSCIIDPGPIAEDHIHVVAAVVWSGAEPRRFLIGKRQSGKHLAGYWEFPGGKLEFDESPRAALSRELREEVNIEPTSCAPFMQVYYRYPEKNVLLDIWVVDEYRGEVRAGEQQALDWIGVDQIEDYRFPPADIPVLDALRRLERTAG